MSLALIGNMFSSAARVAAKGTQQVLSKAGPAARAGLQALSKQAGPALKAGFKYAKNVGKQSVKVLKRKEKSSKRVSRRSTKFWRWGNRRLRQLNRELVNASPNEAAEVQDERRMLRNEQSAIQHIKADAQGIFKTFRQVRKHDLKPLLRQSNHAAKIAVLEDKKGAIDPNILTKYRSSEMHLLKRIQQEEGYQQQVEKDEFRMFKLLRASLLREYKDLKKELREEQGKEEKNKKTQRNIHRRMKQILAEVYMIDHTLKLAQKGDINEQILRKKSQGIYANLEGLKNLARKAHAIVQAAPPKAREKPKTSSGSTSSSSPSTSSQPTQTGLGFFAAVRNIIEKIKSIIRFIRRK